MLNVYGGCLLTKLRWKYIHQTLKRKNLSYLNDLLIWIASLIGKLPSPCSSGCRVVALSSAATCVHARCVCAGATEAARAMGAELPGANHRRARRPNARAALARSVNPRQSAQGVRRGCFVCHSTSTSVVTRTRNITHSLHRKLLYPTLLKYCRTLYTVSSHERNS